MIEFSYFTQCTHLLPLTTTCQGFQWRIQDFPEGGAPTPEGGAPTYYLANFSRKLHENKEILGPRGGRASLAPPPRSANGFSYFTQCTHLLLLTTTCQGFSYFTQCTHLLLLTTCQGFSYFTQCTHLLSLTTCQGLSSFTQCTHPLLLTTCQGLSSFTQCTHLLLLTTTC